MRLVMMGTGPFAVPTFCELYESPHTVVALVTGASRPQPGNRPPPVNLMREAALRHGTPIFDPDDINTEAARAVLALYKADLLVVCDYGQILAADTLATAPLGGINLHASLLPQYRGAAPIVWAIYDGRTETGVTVIHMTPKVDAGPCVAQVRVPIDPDETAGELEIRLAEAGARLVRQTLELFETGRSQALPLPRLEPQNADLASRAPRLKKSDGLIDWQRPAIAIKNQIRAMEPWPKSYTYWHRSDHGPALRLILGPVRVLDTPGGDAAAPGTVLQASGDCLTVTTGEGVVAIQSAQPAGKRLLPVEEFLRGYRVQPGDRFGPE
jgi:methionyl-tRNA formyltransferase